MSEPLQQFVETEERQSHLRLVGNEDARSVGQLVDDAQCAERQGQRDEARSIFERALLQLADRGQAPIASAILRGIARTYQMDANLDAALDCVEAALAVAEACGDEAAAGHAINLKANVRAQQGELDEAERLYVRARHSALRSGEAKLAAMTAQNLGVIANIRGDLLKALSHYETSLADYRALGLVKDVCIALNNLGKLYTDMQRWDAAERAYEEAVQITTVLGDLSTRITLEVNFAELLISQGEFERAELACDRAMEMATNLRDTHAHGETHKVYGIIARETGHHVEAEEHFATAERIASERQNVLLLAETVRERAELHRRQGRNRDTLQCLNRAHRLFSQLRARRALADVDRRNARLESEFLEVVRRWGESIESKDRYTQGHCARVADLACAVAAKAGLEPSSLFWFRIGALLHDVGKLIIPPELLNKPGKLTDEEWVLIKQHPVAGVEMLADIEFPWDVLPLVESHHERWDGQGYPCGLAGEAIPFTARILCLADVYDALTSDRSYKKAIPHADAMIVMRSEVGRHFDPDLFRHFEEVIGSPWSMIRHTEPTPPAVSAWVPRCAARNQTDDLTGLLLRRAFTDAATRLLADSGEASPVSLLVLDVDHFKLVNDTFGHLQGDDVLRGVAELLRQHAGENDVIGRYAGDEFILALPGRPLDAAVEVAQRLRAGIAARRFVLRDAAGGEIAVTVSIGVSAAPEHGQGMELLFAAADRALYDAKREGRDSVAIASSPDGASRQPQLHLENFAGRVDELQRLVRLLDASVEGSPKVAAVVGEAGVGKSTLLRRLVPEVRLRSGSLVVGRCTEADVRPPYGPWAEILLGVNALGIVPDRRWSELARIAPSIADGVPAIPSGQAGSKYALFDEIAEYLRLAAARRPLVVVLDDMQWADTATWDTLEHLLPQLDRDRLMICLTIRSEDAAGDVMERRRRLSRDERFRELTLSRLTRGELKQWMEVAFHRQEAGKDLLAFVYRHTEGNPLFVTQVMRSLVEEGAIWHAGDQWAWRPVAELQLPIAVSDLISRRLARLSPKSRRILTTAAVIGRVFDIDLAVASGAGSEDELLDAIDEGIAAAVLEPVDGADSDRVAFAHGLLVDTVRRSANTRRLKRIHENVARAMETRMPSAMAEIAAHYDQSGNAGKAYEYAMLAGMRATSVYAHDEAMSLFSIAQRRAGAAEEVAEARLRLAQVAESAGRYAEAESLCDLVLGSMTAATDATHALPVRRMRERLRALQGLPPLQTLEACRKLLAEAEAKSIEGERIALLTMISQSLSRLGQWADAEALAREGLRMAEEMGDPRLLADAFVRLGTTVLDTRPQDAIVLYRQALSLFMRADDRHGQVRCHINTGIAHAWAGDGRAAEEAYELALELGHNAHAPDLGGLASLNLGVLYLKGGRYDRARERFERALQLFSTVRNAPRRLAALYNLAHLERERDDASAALKLYDETTALARSTGQVDVEIGALAGAGLAGMVLGDRVMAERGLRGATALIGDRADWWFQGRELLEALTVRSMITDGEVGRAEVRFHAALALAEQHDLYGAAWLLAECTAPLAVAGVSEIWELVARYEPQVTALGFAPLSARYAALRGRGERSLPHLQLTAVSA